MYIFYVWILEIIENQIEINILSLNILFSDKTEGHNRNNLMHKYYYS